MNAVSARNEGKPGVAKQLPGPRVGLEEAVRRLDAAEEALRNDRVWEGMQMVHHDLGVLRSELGPEDWKRWVATVFNVHPVAGMLREDPLTGRCFEKPRGYAGDAELLDLVYEPIAPGSLSARARSVYGYTYCSGGSVSVRWRRDFLTHCIDQVAQTRHAPVVVSIACGHLREVQQSSAMRRGGIGRLVGIDHDATSLTGADQAMGPGGLEPVQASIRDILTARVELPPADLIYASGILDYLTTPIAVGLMRRCRQALVPGGILVVANLTPTLLDAGYMEAAMDWWLTYRALHDLEQAAGAAARSGDMIQMISDPLGNLAIARLVAGHGARRGSA